MGQFGKNQKIEFILGNIESIKNALKKYQFLLQNDEVVIDQVHDVEFVHVENRTIKPLQSIHGDLEILKKIEEYSQGTYTNRALDFNDSTSEGIFFSHALTYPELLTDVVKTAKEIVNYARRHNDTWEMWADDMSVFGLDPIYILAKKHPEYTYLMGAYMIPYWDTEHARYVLEYMASIYFERGFDDEVMKAFCYCDNSEGRDALINNDWHAYDNDAFDLETYFKENSEKYELFKSMMKDRFKNQRYIQYSEQNHTKRPIEDFYCTILNSSKSNKVDEDEELDLEVLFIDDTYDNEAYKLHMEIEEYVGEPLTDPYKDPYDDEDDEYEEEEENIWEDFFVNGFEYGEEIWNYILYGEDDSILEEIKPINIIKLAKEKDLLIQKKIKWHIGEGDSFMGEFHNIFQDFINDYYEEDNNGFIMNVNGVDPSGRDIVIRALDVFTMLLDHHVYNYDLYRDVVSYGIMNSKKFIERYDSKCKFFLGGLSNLIGEASWGGSRSIGGALNRIYEFMGANREEALILLKGEALKGNIEVEDIKKSLSEDSITREVQAQFYKNGLEIESTSIRFATYMLNKDFENRVMDDLTKFFMEIVEENWINMFLEILKEESELTEEDLHLVKRHIMGRPMPPRELMMKVMKEGPDSLTIEEKTLLNPKAETVELEEIIPILKEKLEQEIDRDDPQIQYEIFDTFDNESMLVLIPALYLGALKVRMPSSQSMKRAIKILLELAPMRVMKSAFYINPESGLDGIHDNGMWYDFRQHMKSLCKDHSKVLAWEILDRNDDRYNALVQAYIEDEDSSGFSFIKVESRADIEKALSHLCHSEKERFYEAVAEEDETVLGDVHDKMFYDTIPDFIEDSLKSCEDAPKERIDEITKDLIEYIKGNIDMDSIEYIKDEIGDLRANSYFTSGLWKIDEDKRRRLLLFLKEFGLGGIEAAFDSYEVEAIEYIELLMDMNTPYKIVNEFLIDLYDEDAYCEFAMRLNPFEYVKGMSVGDRIKALEMASYKPSLADFIGDMASDSSDRVRSLVDKILGNYSEEDLNKYNYMLVKRFHNSDENAKEILKKYI
ncbi:hypothetical protein IZY60_06505 [Lutibacter sp. B2]|nr:hypothetical protein [Lutibacter sp. B2]